MEELAYTMSSFAGLGREGESQLVSCHALVVQDKLCTRINNVPAYMDINRMVERERGGREDNMSCLLYVFPAPELPE